MTHSPETWKTTSNIPHGKAHPSIPEMKAPPIFAYVINQFYFSKLVAKLLFDAGKRLQANSFTIHCSKQLDLA